MIAPHDGPARGIEVLRRDAGRQSEDVSASLLDDSLVVEEGRKAGQAFLASTSVE